MSYENQKLEEAQPAPAQQRKKSTPPPVDDGGGGGDDGGWLTSYADLMTLVACFFILMMAFANYDPVTFQQKAELMAKHFHGKNDLHEKSEMAKLMDELNHISNKLDVKHNDQGLNITMNMQTLFKIGSADLTQDAEKLINQIIDKVKEKEDDVRVIIEGHTDNIPIIGSRVYPSNWELSGARASTVVRRFEQKGFPSKKLVAMGFADTKPALPNMDKSGKPIRTNQLKNRRIVLKVLHFSKKKVPMGLGVLFKSKQ